jgi:hypothetical protein
MDSANAAVARFPPRALRVVTCCLIIHTLIIRAAVTILPGVSVAVRLRLICVLERERSGYRDHPRLEGGEFSVGHVAEPFRDRIGRKMQIQRLRWPAITAVQKRRRGVKACRIRVVVLRKVNQCIDRQTRKLAGFYHQVANGPTVCAVWVVRIRSEFRRPFRPAGRVSTVAFYKTAFARSDSPQQPNLLKPSKP